MNQEKTQNLTETITSAINNFEVQKQFAQVDKYANFFCSEDISLINYFSNNALIFIDEPAKTFDTAQKFYDSYKNKIKITGYHYPNNMSTFM